MATNKAVATLVAVALVAAAMSAGGATTDDCDAGKLAPCFPAIVFGSKPSGKCCSHLRDQKRCFCQFAKDPAYSKYINSPHARHALGSCGVAVPNCG